MNYYNEHDPHAAAWLRNLIAAGEIPQGEVDERDIQDIKAAEIAGYTQCHFFAGIAGWPLALKLAGWPDDRPVWTASLPCQPFSVAGRRRGHDDERHLWPVFFELVQELRPSVCFGEQVSSKDGLVWLDGVSDDLESAGYAVGAFDLCAAGVSAPHIRQRLYWVAESQDYGWKRREGTRNGGPGVAYGGGGMGESISSQDYGKRPLDESGRDPLGRQEQAVSERPCGSNGIAGSSEGVGDAANTRRPPRHEERFFREEKKLSGFAERRPTLNAWDDYELRTGADGATRRVEPGLECLVDGLSFQLADGRSREDASRSKILKGLGNAIVPPLAAEFIGAYMFASL